MARNQIIVLGMHRSGTSAATALLEACGAWLGTKSELKRPQPQNPKGFFERRDMRRICDALLHSAGADWWKVREFTAERVSGEVATAQRAAMRRLARDLDGHGAWAIKEPRLCLVLPSLLPVLTDPVVVLVVRHPLEVARSLRRRNGMPRVAALALWEAYNVHALHAAAGLPSVVVSYDDLIADPTAAGRRFLRELMALGVEALNPPASIDVLDPRLRHEQRGQGGDAALLSPAQDDLWRALSQGRLEGAASLEISPAAQLILQDFEEDREPLIRLAESASALAHGRN